MSTMDHAFDLEGHLQRHGGALRRLGYELLRDPVAVDDALQETWLRALRRPPGREEQAGGWLATILRHVAFRSRRGDVRRVRREREAARGEAAGDHAEAIARAEIAQRLLAAVNELDAPYGDTIWQRYFEDLPPRAIAQRSGVPVATVKSRLQRGLQQLRERLGEEGEPSDWRAALGVAFGFGKGAATVATAAAWQGGLLMAAWSKGVAAAVVVGVVAFVSWPRDTPTAIAVAAPVDSAAPSVVVVPLGEEGLRTERQVLPMPTDPLVVASDAPPTPGVVRGRVVDGATQQPLAGVEVELQGGKPGDAKPTATTGGDGSFAIAARVGGPTSLHLRRDDRVTVGRSATVEPNGVEDLGTVPMLLGRRLSGRIVHEAGGAVPSDTFVAITFVKFAPGLSSWRHPEARPDVAGRFITSEPVVFGTSNWIVHGQCELTAPVHIEVDDKVPSEVVLTVRDRPRITGFVVDESGRAAVGVRLSDQSGLGMVPVGDDGGFTIWKQRPTNEPSTSVFVSEAPDYEPHEPIAEVAWGTPNLRIVLQRARPFALEVVDDRGVPVELFGVALQRPGLSGLTTGTVRQRGEHAGGKLAVERVARGRTNLRVLPVEPDLTPSEPIAVGHDEPLRVVLARREALEVLVLSGVTPAADVAVQLVRERGGVPPGPPPGVLDPATAPGVWMYGLGAELVSAGTTDTLGHVSLRRDAELAGCVLRLQAQGRPVALVRDLAVPRTGEPMRVQLPGHGSIAGRVELRGHPRSFVRILLPTAITVPGRMVLVQSDGGFVVPDLQEGTYPVVLERSTGGHFQAVPGGERDVAVLPGAPTEVRFDLADFALASVRGVVTADRPLPPELAVDFYPVAEGRAIGANASAAIRTDGTFAIDALLPGTYRIGFRTQPALATSVSGLLAETFVLPGATETQLALRFAPRRLVVKLQRPGGGAVVGERVVVRCAGATWPSLSLLAPTVDRELVLDPAPMLPIEFRGWRSDAAWSVPVVMPPDRSEAEVTVILPDPPQPR